MSKSQKALRKEWIKALRSGKYEQCTGQLRDVDTYCCLGVLCEIALKKGLIKGYNSRSLDLPEEVRESVGLTTTDGQYNDTENTILDLTTLNDTRKLSFKKIANVIEKEPNGLFVD